MCSQNQKQTQWWCCFVFFASACVIHVTMRDWLCYLVTKAKALGTKKCKSLRRSINEGLYNLIPKETCIAKWKKLPAEKSNSKSKKNMTVKDKGLSLFLFDWFWKGFCQLSNFHYFFFSWLIFNHMHKCIQAKTFETQICWSLDSCTH